MEKRKPMAAVIAQPGELAEQASGDELMREGGPGSHDDLPVHQLVPLPLAPGDQVEELLVAELPSGLHDHKCSLRT